MNIYEFICNIYEFLNLVGSYDPCYDPPIHDLMGPTRSYLGSRVCLPCSGGRGRGIRVCSLCGRTGRKIDTCFKKHGFFPHYQQESFINNHANVIGN